MNTSETTEATAAIGMMLKAFPSSQSSMSDDSARVYLFAVQEFDIEAVKRACRQIVRGEVAGLNPDFAPTAPKLAQIVSACEQQLHVERYYAERLFVEEGSDLWRQLELHRGSTSFPSYVKDGKKGWHFRLDEVAEARKLALPPPLTEAQMEENRTRFAKMVETGQVSLGNDAEGEAA